MSIKNVSRNFYIALSLVLIMSFMTMGCSKKSEESTSSDGKVTISWGLAKGANSEAGFADIVEEFSKLHPEIEVVPFWGPQSTTEQLAFYLQGFEARSADIDLIQVDVIWPGDIGDHLVTLDPYVSEELISKYNPAAVQNNRVNGELKALPLFVDFGVLYYRHDLLKKYGYDSPPKTWEELEEIAMKVQTGERAAGKDSFWGFVWQGQSYEGLTCDAIEWIYSVGGGSIVEADGRISINNPAAAGILDIARGWIGTISPDGTLNFKEEDSRKTFQAGNAMFMRNWPYASALAKAEDSVIKDSFSIAPLPGKDGRSASTLGGWQIAISKYSDNLEEAVIFAKYLSGPENSKREVLRNHQIPAYLPIFDDPEVIKEVPELAQYANVSKWAVARPSTPTSPHYAEISRIFYRAVHDVLSGKTDGTSAVEEMEIRMSQILNK